MLPDEPVVRGPEDTELMEALRKLREVDRELLRLSFWEDLQPTEIARVLGISRAAVDQRLLVRELVSPKS